MKTNKQLVKLFKALSHPHRLELFLRIRKRELTNLEEKGEKRCFLLDLLEGLKIGAPTISHHLKELTNANLIETEREGKFLVCNVNEDTLKELDNFFQGKVNVLEGEKDATSMD